MRPFPRKERPDPAGAERAPAVAPDPPCPGGEQGLRHPLLVSAGHEHGELDKPPPGGEGPQGSEGEVPRQHLAHAPAGDVVGGVDRVARRSRGEEEAQLLPEGSPREESVKGAKQERMMGHDEVHGTQVTSEVEIEVEGHNNPSARPIKRPDLKPGSIPILGERGREQLVEEGNHVLPIHVRTSVAIRSLAGQGAAATISPMAGRTGTADLPLHGGHAPRWLFARMVRLSREIVLVLADEFGTEGVLARLSDPCWFQGLGCFLGFDWHSSGLTTTACGALKEALHAVGEEIGLWAAGGKGAASRRTPLEIAEASPKLAVEPGPLVYASRMTAKVDSAALQDGFQIYHHSFFFDRAGRWCVVQQGMNETTGLARRYHWSSEVGSDFVCEPHTGIVGPRSDLVLNLVAQESDGVRRTIPALAREPPDQLVNELGRARRMTLPRRHALLLADLDPRRLRSVFLSAYESEAADFAGLLATPGVGAKGLRALALLAELLYGVPVSFRDPARFAYAHGGKDGTPYPVDRETYDRTIEVLGRAVRRAKLGERDELCALSRLARVGASLTMPPPGRRPGPG